MNHFGCSIIIGMLLFVIVLLSLVILWLYKYAIELDYFYAVWYNDEGSTIIIEEDMIILRPDKDSDKTYSQKCTISREILSPKNNIFYLETPSSKYRLECNLFKGEIAVYKDEKYLGIYSKNLISSLSD